jgi:hypothetical protein
MSLLDVAEIARAACCARAASGHATAAPPSSGDELASSYVEHGLPFGTRLSASLLQAQHAPEAPAGPWGRPESF